VGLFNNFTLGQSAISASNRILDRIFRRCLLLVPRDAFTVLCEACRIQRPIEAGSSKRIDHDRVLGRVASLDRR
jgi:hypothetical protein